MKLESLNSALFDYEHHVNDFGSYLGLSYGCWSKIPESKDTELHRALKRYAIGWCDGERLCFKPRYGLVGIMCEKDGEKFWFHIQQKTFDDLFETSSH